MTYSKKKTHTIAVPGKGGKDVKQDFTFNPGERKSLAQDIALRFLEIDPAFVVRNTNDQIIRPRHMGDPKDRMVLVKAHEIVVPLTAVLKTHLFEIARELPGGDRWNSVDTLNREDLEEFIITGGKVEEEDLVEDEAEQAA